MKKHRYFIVTALLALLLQVLPSGMRAVAQAAYKPKDEQLYKAILHMDSVTFNAFNTQNLEVLKSVFAKDVEFYNDGGGVSGYETTMANFKAMFERNKTSGLRRELDMKTFEVYPMPGFGAIETASHRFIHTENGKQEIGYQKFISVWRLENNQWKIARMISLGH